MPQHISKQPITHTPDRLNRVADAEEEVGGAASVGAAEEIHGAVKRGRWGVLRLVCDKDCGESRVE